MNAPVHSAATPAAAPARPAPDWDPWSAEALADPFAAQAQVRQKCPFPFSDRQGGFRAITRYADIVQATMDTVHFKNGLRPKLGRAMPPLETDPPDHTTYRRLLRRPPVPCRRVAVPALFLGQQGPGQVRQGR